MTFDEYLATPGYSNSMVKLLPDEPETFAGLYITRQDVFVPTASMLLGTALHSVLLEGKPIPTIPASVLNADGHRKGGKWIEYKKANPDVVLTEAEAEATKKMVGTIYGHPQARRLLEAPGPIEHSIFWVDEITGLPLKMRLDKLAEFGSDRVLVDAKTAFSISELDMRSFRKSATYQKYHRQVAWYYVGIEHEYGVTPEGFCYIASKNKAPFNCEVFELDESAIELGRQQNRVAIDDLKRRLDTGDWHSPTHGKITVIDLEPWAYKEMEMPS